MYSTKTFWIRSCIQRIIKCDVILKPQNSGYAGGDCTHCMDIKVCLKEFFYVKTAKIHWQLGATSPDPLGLRRLGIRPQTPGYVPPPLAKFWVHHCIWGQQFLEPPRAAEPLATPLCRRHLSGGKYRPYALAYPENFCGGRMQF